MFAEKVSIEFEIFGKQLPQFSYPQQINYNPSKNCWITIKVFDQNY